MTVRVHVDISSCDHHTVYSHNKYFRPGNGTTERLIWTSQPSCSACKLSRVCKVGLGATLLMLLPSGRPHNSSSAYSSRYPSWKMWATTLPASTTSHSES